MQRLLVVLALGLTPVASQDASPIRKVVTLIEEMKATVEKEAKDDTTAYDKYACWCKTNDQEKSSAIEEAESQIASLSAFIEEAAAKEGELKTEISQLEQDIAEDTTALKTATANREEEHQTFLAEEEDFKETRGLLQEAVAVLDKVQLLQKQGKKAPPALAAQAKTAAAALLQISGSIQKSHPEFQNVMQKDLFDVMGSLEEEAPRSLRKGTALAQSKLLPWETTAEQDGAAAKPNELQGAAAGAKSYNARSGGIVGILKEMQDEFSRDLSKSQYEDMEAEIAFQKLSAAKNGEIESATKQRNSKETQLADLSDRKAKAKEDKEATEASLTADQKFLMNLKKDCKSEDEEFQIRVKARGEELVALSETLKILTEDDARELFGKTISFVQLQSASSEAERSATQDRALDRAMQRIAKVAKAHKNWMLATLAVRVRLDAFTKVKEVMDKMLVELDKQQKEEYAKMEQCKKDIDETEDSIKVAENNKDDLGEKHLGLSNLIETLTKEIADLQKEEADMEVSLKQAGEARKAQSKEFQSAVMDQRATINILNKALKRLNTYYNTKAGAFVQQAPPPKPSNQQYEKSGGASGVLQLLQKVITEAEIAEQEIVTSNQKAQSDYAEFVQDTSDSIQAARDSISNKQGQLAGANGDKSQTEEGQLANGEELGKLEDLLKAHHLDCDYVMKYFDMRQTARQEEMDAIKDAKAILSGADFGK